MIRPTRLPPVGEPGPARWSERTLSSYLDDAARHPDRLAVVDDDVRLDYGQLLDHTQAFAAGLRRHGVGHGDVVTVDLPNWWEAIVAMHAVLRLGAVVNPVIPIYRDAEVGFILRQSAARAVVVPHRFRGFDYVAMLARVAGDLAVAPLVVVVRPEGPLPEGFVSFDEVCSDREGVAGDEAIAEEIALLLYTSGTTADSKGVLHSHQTIEYENRSIIELFSLGGDDSIFMASPVTHITGFLYAVVLPPMLGVAVVLLDVWDPAEARRRIKAEGCRFTVGATPFLAGLAEVYEAAGTVSSLRVFPCGGADVPPELVRRARRVLGASVMRIYGSSEFPTYSCGRLDDDIEIAAETDGRPIGPVEAQLDGAGEVGELLVKGPDLFLGYLDPSLNDASFTDDGFFRTGDLASFHGDAIVIRGRQKDIIIRAGENISAKEVEDLLYEHPSIRAVAVVAMPDERTGEKACAFVVPEPAARVTLADLTAFLTERRIARQKFPERLELVDELPVTASGKVQKFVLRERIASTLAAETVPRT